MIVAYQAENHIASVMQKIPLDSLPSDMEVLVLDDASQDRTVEIALQMANQMPCRVHVLANPSNLGYGGNQKIGYQYAIEEKFDAVVMLHGDGQYAPEYLPKLLNPILNREAEVVMGSRMLQTGSALRGGMPFYKWIGNKILTAMENRITGLALSEFHTGYRAYSTKVLQRIPFEYNANQFHFDTEILIQLALIKEKIVEIPIPTHYGDEICRVNGWLYFFNCLKSCWQSYLTSKGLCYRRKFDLKIMECPYESKFGIPYSSHESAILKVPNGSSVLDIGGGNGWVADKLTTAKGCSVSIVDQTFRKNPPLKHQIFESSLDEGLPENLPDADVVLLLDIIEHLNRPAQVRLLDEIRGRYDGKNSKVIITVPNTAFLPLRLMFFFGGKLNYGRRGILDETHAFLFTRSSLMGLMDESEYVVTSLGALPAPYRLAFGENLFSDGLTHLHALLANLFPSLFAYQFIIETEPRPTVRNLLGKSRASLRSSISSDDLRVDSSLASRQSPLASP